MPALPGWTGPDEFRHYVRALAQQYVRRPEGKSYVEIWVEAGGMQPQIQAVADPFGVRVVAGGGFSSVTARHTAADRLMEITTPITILLLGDFDPSGQSIMDVSAEDVTAFGAIADFEHLAVTEAQAQDYGLPSKPQKATDKRGERMAETWQAEALDPHVLANIVQTRLQELVGATALNRARRMTQAERADLLATWAEKMNTNHKEDTR